MNTLFVLLIGTCHFSAELRIRSRCLLILMALPVGWVYFLSNGRAAVVGLLAGLVVLSVVLFWRQPRTFFKPFRSCQLSCRVPRHVLELEVRRRVPRPSRQVGLPNS